MKIQKRSLIALLILAAVIALAVAPLMVSNIVAARAAHRRTAARVMILGKLKVYEHTHGHFPESLSLLSFTNSLPERDLVAEVQKFDYHVDTEGGFRLEYRK